MPYLPAARQFFARNAAPPPLPYDAEVKWLGSDGGQYIDTGVTAQEDTQLECRGMWVSIVTGGVKKAVSGNSSGRQDFSWTTTRIGSNFGFSACTGTSTGAAADTDWHDVKLCTLSGEQSYTFDGAKTVISTLESPPSCGNISLFGTLSGTYMGICRLASCKITKPSTGAVIRDLIPVRFTNELGQSEGAMYDRVSGQLFRNAGTGAFVIGPDAGASWADFDFTGITSMTPVRSNVTLPCPFSGGADITKMKVGMVSDSRIVVCDTTGPNIVGVYDFDSGHEFELNHLNTTPFSYRQTIMGGTYPAALVFDSSGLVAYEYTNTGNSGENRFTMSAPFDLSVATLTHNAINYLGDRPTFVGFSADGTSFYWKLMDDPVVHQRLLVNPYDNVTKPYSGTKTVNLDTLTGTTPSTITWKGFCISPDGQYAVCTSGNGTGKVWKFRFGTPWDIETLVFLGMGVIQETYMYPVSVVINSAGTRMIVSNNGTYGQGLWEYDLTALR